MSAITDFRHPRASTRRGILYASVSSVVLYVAQSLLMGTMIGPSPNPLGPAWTDPPSIVGVLLFAAALGVGLTLLPTRTAFTLTVPVLAWVTPPLIAAALAAPTLSVAINSAAIVILFAFLYHLSGVAALFLAALSLVLMRRVASPNRDRLTIES